jgi:hypothetical protein
MLTPYLYRVPEKLKGILHYDKNEELYFVFGDKYMSLETLKKIIGNNSSKVTISTQSNQRN